MKPDPDKLRDIAKERSLVLIKPDAVYRKIVGELIQRFERKGIKIVAMKMVWPDDELVDKHYTDDEEWLMNTGTNTYEGYKKRGEEPPAEPRELGLNTRRKLMNYLSSGPVVALVLEGAHVIELVRKLRGSTSPRDADVGTVGFDYSLDSYQLSDAGDWATQNIIHASDSPENAEKEIALWFEKDEIYEYQTALDHVLYSNEWQQERRTLADEDESSE